MLLAIIQRVSLHSVRSEGRSSSLLARLVVMDSAGTVLADEDGNYQRLEDFLDPEDPTKTVEGYSAPKRVYVRLTKKPKAK